MGKAFLSHSSKQKKLVQEIADFLGRDRCIFDDYDFEIGMPIAEEIMRGLSNTDIFVIFISNESLNSKWVQDEILSAKSLLNVRNIEKIYPILIDNSINPTKDERIPNWMLDYLLKPVNDAFIIKQKIAMRLREVSLKNNTEYTLKQSTFIGRNELLRKFENEVFSFENKPKCVIVSGLEGIGRRTFLKNAFKKEFRWKDHYEPIYLNLDTKDSIEDFILKLKSDIIEKDFIEKLFNLSLEDKLNEAIFLIGKLRQHNEFLFIIDKGCIIKPSSFITDWFVDLVSRIEKGDEYLISLISTYRPSNRILKNSNYFLSYHVLNLSDAETRNLFIRYCNISSIELNDNEAGQIIDKLNGIPSQIAYATNYLTKFGIKDTLNDISNIIQFGESRVIKLINDIKEDYDKLYYDILILISRLEFCSHDLIYEIAHKENKDILDKVLEELYVYGVFEYVGQNKEYIQVNFPIVNYVLRNKIDLNPNYKFNLKKSIESFLKNEERINNFQDISMLLHNIKGALIEGHKLPEKYYIPSFVLKSVVELYYTGKYKNVVSLADKVLERKNNLDDDIKREFKIWLCHALIRLKDKRFETEVSEIEGSEYYYLNGFYNRKLGFYSKAAEYLGKALKYNTNFQQARRELINVLLHQENYKEALDLSRRNFIDQPHKPFHIQAYFICLIKKGSLNSSDKIVLKELIDRINKSVEYNAEDFRNVMNAEYEYYVNGNVAESIKMLKNCIKVNKNTNYPLKALKAIYNRAGLYAASNEVVIDDDFVEIL